MGIGWKFGSIEGSYLVVPSLTDSRFKLRF